MIHSLASRTPLRAAAAGLALIISLCFAAAIGASAARAADYVPGTVIVGYRTAATFHSDALSRGGRRAGGSKTTIRTVHLRKGESVSAAIARLRHTRGVAYALPDYIARTADGFYPNDGGRSRRYQGWEQMQWNLLPDTGVNAPQAWSNLLADHRPGGRGVIVAVLDTGVAYRNWHKFRRSPDFGRARFVAPYDFIAHNRYPLDRNGHGTFVAGVIAESTNNGIGLAGLAYGASIMPVRVLDASGEGDESTIAKGIRYAVKHGAQVINLSLEFLPNQVSSGAEIPELMSAINYAHRHGVTIVGAAGNDETMQIAYPARARNVISVGATTKDRCLAAYSNGGSGLDLVAPGGGDDAVMPSDPDCHPERSLPAISQMTLTDPGHWGRFGYPGDYIGTSMASPAVAATAALIIASGVLGPNPSPDQILARLEETATPLPAAGPKPNSEYGYGLINAGLATAPGPAVDVQPTPASSQPAPTPSSGSTTPNAGGQGNGIGQGAGNGVNHGNGGGKGGGKGHIRLP